ncbi:MAG: Plug domain-containing protein [Mongoliibacter sp.]|uniref:Plug domain-containing protein n=1 Tax=Mongoliibacter sp. TaxID=2022438 RepID=UPI0012F3ADF1|nr:Plug domain-containing protein [Mongoliibacter sp.]TVP53326.1 MAG: Plug domain-containing protein [Mongoliibacter sp.]
MKKATFSLFSFVFIFFAKSFAQSPASNLQSSLEDYQRQVPFEKVYLHTDKPHYLLNDTIWIKAYGTMETGELIPNPTASAPLYINLYKNIQKEPIMEEVMKLEKGWGVGDIILPRDLSPGNYQLVAYTAYSEEKGWDYLFTKDIWIGDIRDAFVPRIGLEGNMEVNFFPEGGDLVEGLKSTMGIKAVGDKGLGVPFHGYLVDDTRDTVARFESNMMGMGRVKFTSEKGRTYQAFVKTADTEWKAFPIPPAKENGAVLSVLLEEERDVFEINISEKDTESQRFWLLGIAEGKLIYDTEISLEKGEASLMLEKDDFPTGIIQFSLFDENLRPVAERLVFFHPFAQAEVDFNFQKESFRPKETVELDMLIKDEFGVPIKGDFSISVTDAGQVMNPEFGENIFTHYRLSSEIKGAIENPYYYFDSKNEDAYMALDNLMLTQGWRRFSWKEVMEKEDMPEARFETGLSISGNVKVIGGNPVKEPREITMMIYSLYFMPEVLQGTTDEKGSFKFENLDFYDSVAVFTQAYTEKIRKAAEPKIVKANEISLENKVKKPRPEKLITAVKELDKDKLDETYLVTAGEAQRMMEQFILGQEVELGEVVIEAKSHMKKPDQRAMLYGDNPEKSITVTEEHFVYANFYHLIRGRFAGVNVVGDVFDYSNPPSVQVRGGTVTGNASGREQMGGAQIWIDGHPVDDAMAMTLQMVDIERVDVMVSLARTAMLGGPVVNVLTRTGSPNPRLDEDPRLGMGNELIFTKGYLPYREFYVPSNEIVPEEVYFTDYRSTIYWNPLLKSDLDGKISLSFPLTEGRTEVDIIIEGLSESKEPVFGKYTIQVD